MLQIGQSCMSVCIKFVHPCINLLTLKSIELAIAIVCMHSIKVETIITIDNSYIFIVAI